MHHIYIHIPFCLKKCRYCSFYSVEKKDAAEPFMKALLAEVRDCGDIYGGTEIETIFFGGGTPSIISSDDIAAIIEKIREHWMISKNAEVTLEINPETVDDEKLRRFKDAGVNRASIGIQSFDDDELKYLGRIHDSQKAKEALKSAVDIFDNVSCDLMFGLPHQTREGISKNIRTAAEFRPQHISCYELTFEEGTEIFRDKNKIDTDDPSLYLHAKELLEKSGYRQYEISNYSLQGHECRHNVAYWSNKSYLGLGPSAHSYDSDKKIRWANKSDVKEYLGAERISFTEKAEDIDLMIMGLRQTAGMPTSSIPEQYRKAIFRLTADGLLKEDGGQIALTAKGALLANNVLLKIALSLI